jgi:hypothetical protein
MSGGGFVTFSVEELAAEVNRLRAVNAALVEALEAWQACDAATPGFDDSRYINRRLSERARALSSAALASASIHTQGTTEP